jgi:protein-S-isoprenylcysteine O-methyltransferase Ste14
MSFEMRKILPPTLGLFCLLGMLILDQIFPLVSITSIVLVIIGLGLVGMGIMMAFAAERQFRRVGTTVNPFGQPTTLVTEGWFRYSRNPMYLSLALILMGAWITLGSLSPALGVIVYLFITDRWYIPQEEKRLTATFGMEYESYRMRTRRWL